VNWKLSHRADPAALALADRHYNRQKIGTPQFVPPGRCVVLVIPECAVWVTSWPFAEYVKHQWAGAWVNSIFRREDGPQASELIRQAIAITRWIWEPPPLGIVTFINRDKVKRKRDYGRCYLKAGFKVCGETKGGLLALQMLPCDMPEAMPMTASIG
jgi:hypothetical protein